MARRAEMAYLQPALQPCHPGRVGGRIVGGEICTEVYVEIDTVWPVTGLNQLTVAMAIEVLTLVQCAGTAGHRYSQCNNLSHRRLPEGPTPTGLALFQPHLCRTTPRGCRPGGPAWPCPGCRPGTIWRDGDPESFRKVRPRERVRWHIHVQSRERSGKFAALGRGEFPAPKELVPPLGNKLPVRWIEKAGMTPSRCRPKCPEGFGALLGNRTAHGRTALGRTTRAP